MCSNGSVSCRSSRRRIHSVPIWEPPLYDVRVSALAATIRRRGYSSATVARDTRFSTPHARPCIVNVAAVSMTFRRYRKWPVVNTTSGQVSNYNNVVLDKKVVRLGKGAEVSCVRYSKNGESMKERCSALSRGVYRSDYCIVADEMCWFRFIFPFQIIAALRGRHDRPIPFWRQAYREGERRMFL